MSREQVEGQEGKKSETEQLSKEEENQESVGLPMPRKDSVSRRPELPVHLLSTDQTD